MNMENRDNLFRLQQLLDQLEEEGLYYILVEMMADNLETQMGKLLPVQIDEFKVLSTKRNLLNEFIEAIQEIQNIGRDGLNEETAY